MDDAERVPTREGYDRWAEIYDGEDNPLVALEGPRVTALLGDVRGVDVVDLGCGTGRHAAALAAAGARVTALDYSDGMVARARAKRGWERVRFIAHDLARPLPLPDAGFDRVLCCLVVEHLVDLGAFLRECRRVCRPDGFVLITAMHPALMLTGLSARFVDPATGRRVYPQSHRQQLSDYVMAGLEAPLRLERLEEHVVDEALAARMPRAAKYLGWPMLAVLRFRP